MMNETQKQEIRQRIEWVKEALEWLIFDIERVNVDQFRGIWREWETAEERMGVLHDLLDEITAQPEEVIA